jgi:hypothetical protein
MNVDEQRVLHRRRAEVEHGQNPDEHDLFPSA